MLGKLRSDAESASRDKNMSSDQSRRIVAIEVLHPGAKNISLLSLSRYVKTGTICPKPCTVRKKTKDWSKVLR